MSELSISIQGASVSDVKAKLKAGFRALAEAADEEETLHTNVRGLEWQHDEWEHGDPCPECGSVEFHCGQIEYSIYEATEHGMEYKERDGGSPAMDFTGVMCNDPSCMAQLYRGPASYLAD